MNSRGVSYFQRGQTRQALAEFQNAVATNPRNADAYYNLAATYHQVGRQRTDKEMLRQAEDLYHQCLDLHPNHVACHRALAVMLVDTDRPKSAFTLLERWAERAPNYAEPKIELARLHEEFGQKRETRRYLTEAIDADPRSARAWTALARLRESDGELAQALNNYEQAYRLNSYQPGVANQIASLRQRIASNSRPFSNVDSRRAENDRGNWQQR
ncbi:MAG: tetratricopeptide repeat protein [Planctomycetales bacterium]|nr:tetratricopeptide repeat protein [Planctomycetales bacterium]